jgi:hypothetical protein
MTYDEYERFCIEKREQFYEEFDEFIDMENPADLKFNIDFGEICCAEGLRVWHKHHR